MRPRLDGPAFSSRSTCLWRILWLLLLAPIACGEARSCGSGKPAADAGDQTRASAPPPAAGFVHRSFPDAATAVAHVLERTRPRVVGFGEYHQVDGTASVLSTLERFRREILPVIAPNGSDLVVETWISAGGCGTAEQQVVSQVDQVTERPDVTANETVALIEDAQARGLKPHILELDCAAYERLLDRDGGLDYFAMLELVGQSLERKGATVLKARGDDPRLVALITGAAHNDAAPSEIWAPISYGPGLAAATGGRYVEVDLLVPEFVEASKLALDEPWFPLLKRLAAPDSVWLIELGPTSFIIVLERGVMVAPLPIR
ncbi:MAG TPA: hypothetical protein VM285_04325 [Polyangia bacterium]|nr:hypothetical protein [Polyangia bacterium]